MSTHNLKYLFNPKSVVLIGASKRPSSVGAVIAHNLLSSGFKGTVMMVNPRHEKIEGSTSYPDVGSLPEVPELAVIATPPETVVKIVTELGERGTKAAIIISAGFGELEKQQGKAMQQKLVDVARHYHIRLIGPNCLGILVPGIGLNASFSHLNSTSGKLAFVSQSGAIMTSVLDWATARDIGFSHLVSLGDMAEVDFGDMLDFLANDVHTRAIILYIEAITSARKFMSAARAAARMKPVLVVKVGRHSEGAQAAASHTGSLAGEDGVYDAAFRRAGMLRIYSLEEVFDAVETLYIASPPKGNRLAVLTNGGGLGVLTADALVDQGGQLAQLSSESLEQLNQVLPATWSQRNPVDIIGDATGERYAKALQLLNQDRNIDAILVLNCPTAIASSVEAARAVVENIPAHQKPLLLTSWVGDEQAANDARDIFIRHHIPVYDTPEQAVRAYMYLVNYRRNQALLIETPPSVPEDFTIDKVKARSLIKKVLEEEGSWLSEFESKELLAAYAIPVVTTTVVQTPQQAQEIAATLGVPVALKIVSSDILHKSDAGGVELNLKDSDSVYVAAKEMLQRINNAYPDSHLEGFSVEPMVKIQHAYELIIGMIEDADFGPVMVFGQGGTAVEVINDKALGFPPLNMKLATEMITRTRVHKLLQGYRGFPAANLQAIAMTLIKVSQLVIDNPQIVELDINPLLVDDSNVVALDARVKIKSVTDTASKRLAIRPYPKELEEMIPLGDGRTLLLRPILPEDEPALQAGFAKLTPEEIRFRFFVPVKVLSHVTAARFTQIDYDREMAFVLTDPEVAGKASIYGVVRIIADANNETAEYAVIVSHEMTGMGLGILLMRRIIDYARSRGIGEIYGDVLAENRTMLKLCKVFGFTERLDLEDYSIKKVSLKLKN
ncbi:MAG: bifunctional acetate--CoA ligase family protein/GNAT family N-acetyltransferase [bacterium]|nr:bifunctional acetate--CoA ligase family protein/GNAT family N-acetyltransferase [bacterium]